LLQAVSENIKEKTLRQLNQIPHLLVAKVKTLAKKKLKNWRTIIQAFTALVVTQRILVTVYQCFGTACRSYLKRPRSVSNYEHTLYKNPENENLIHTALEARNFADIFQFASCASKCQEEGLDKIK
jgi:hypothetical protein